MKSAAFAYARPNTLDEALELLAQNEDAKLLAGGQSLLPVMALRLGTPELVVDIGRLDGLDQITPTADGGISIGALVRHADVEDSDLVAERAPLVHLAAPYIGHRAIRNQGTAVGSIAHGDPAAELPAVCLATDAVMVAQSIRGRREIPARDFFVGFLDTALEFDEILVEVRFPGWSSDMRGSVVEVARRHGDYALVGLAVRLSVVRGVIKEAALSFLGVGSTPVRVPEAEFVLVGHRPAAKWFDEAAAIVSSTLEPSADAHGTTNYRKHLAGVLTRRGLADALTQAEVAA